MRNKIITAASELFTDHGVDKTSLAEIAARAKISKGTLYYHFSTKNDLVFAVSEMHMQSLTDNLMAFLKSKEEPGNIVSHLYSTIPTAVTRSRLHIYLVREAVTGSPELKRKFASVYKRWQELLMTGLKELYPKLGDPEAVASFLIASVDGLVIQNLLDIKTVSTDRHVSLVKGVLDS